jgi:hypothetical protein
MQWNPLPKQPTEDGVYILAHRGHAATVVEFKNGIGLGWQIQPGQLNFGPTHWAKLPDFSEWLPYKKDLNMPSEETSIRAFLSDGNLITLHHYLNPNYNGWFDNTETGWQSNSHMVPHDPKDRPRYFPKYMLEFDLHGYEQEGYDRFQYAKLHQNARIAPKPTEPPKKLGIVGKLKKKFKK